MTTQARTLDNYRLGVRRSLFDSAANNIDAYHSWRSNKVLVDQHVGTEWEEEHCENYSLLDHQAVIGCWEHETIEAGLTPFLRSNGVNGGDVAVNATHNAEYAYQVFGGSLSLARRFEIRDLLITLTQRRLVYGPSGLAVFQPLVDKFDDVKFTQKNGQITADIYVMNNAGVFVPETPVMIFQDREKIFDATNTVRVRNCIKSDSSGNVFEIEIPATWKMTINFVGDTTHKFTDSEDGVYSLPLTDWDANVAKVGNFQYAELTFIKES